MGDYLDENTFETLLPAWLGDSQAREIRRKTSIIYALAADETDKIRISFAGSTFRRCCEILRYCKMMPQPSAQIAGEVRAELEKIKCDIEMCELPNQQFLEAAITATIKMSSDSRKARHGRVDSRVDSRVDGRRRD